MFKKCLSFIFILCILCQCALFSISTNAEEIIIGDIQTEEIQFATVEEVLAGLATPEQLPPAYETLKPQGGQYTPLASTPGLNLDGIYYINNIYGGVYLTCPTSTSVAPDGRRGLLNTLGNTTKWMIAEVESGSGIYTIRPMTAYSKYLAFMPSSVYAVLSSTLNDYSKWYISIASHGGVVIQNVGISRYLQSYGDTSFDGTADVNVIPNLPSSSNANYNSYAWRIISHNSYGTSSGYQACEMSAQTTINPIEIGVSSSGRIVFSLGYSNEAWVTPSDFVFTIEDSSLVSHTNGSWYFNSRTELGGTKINAMHKVTGREINFYALVGFSSSINETPLAESRVQGLNQPYDIWPAESESMFYGYSTLTRMECLSNIEQSAQLIVTVGAFANQPDAADFLTHYLDASGDEMIVDLKSVISEWNTASNYRNTHLNLLMSVVEASSTTSSKYVGTIEGLQCEVDESTNWGNAIGRYEIHIYTEYYRNLSGTYTANVTYELHDVYDWDPTKNEMGILPVSQRQLWELHYGGYAKNYKVTGSVSFTLTWSEGQRIGSGAQITNEV